MTVLLAVLFVALQVQAKIPDIQNSLVFQMVALLTARSVYQIVTMLLFWLINHNTWLLRMYWGRNYIDGLWFYEYTLNDERRIGFWDIQQDLEGVRIIGNGLDRNYNPRTVLRSVSPLIEEQGGFFILNSRNDLSGGNDVNFSKTTLLIDTPRRPFKMAETMRGVTEIFGGSADSQIHPDVIFRRTRFSTVDELTKSLAQKVSP